MLLGSGSKKVPAPMAARVLGPAGHVHDSDDTQVSRRSEAPIWDADSPHHPGSVGLARRGPETGRSGRAGFCDRLPYGVRSRVQDCRVHVARSLHEGLPFQRHGRNHWGRRRQALGTEGTDLGERNRPRGEFRRGYSRQLRNDDQTAPRWTRGRKRRERGAVVGSGVHGRCDVARWSVGHFPNIRRRDL